MLLVLGCRLTRSSSSRVSVADMKTERACDISAGISVGATSVRLTAGSMNHQSEYLSVASRENGFQVEIITELSSPSICRWTFDRGTRKRALSDMLLKFVGSKNRVGFTASACVLSIERRHNSGMILIKYDSSITFAYSFTKFL
jgi:hypothetical protein